MDKFAVLILCYDEEKNICKLIEGAVYDNNYTDKTV